MDLEHCVSFMRAHGVLKLSVGDVSLELTPVALRDVASHDVLNSDLTEPGGPDVEESTEERMVREQREHSERESLLFYSAP